MEFVIYESDDGWFVGVSKEDYANNKLYREGRSFVNINDEIIFDMLEEALKQNRFAELDKIIEVKSNGQ